MKFESEARTTLTKGYRTEIFTELVTMLAEENEISLVVKSDCPASGQVRDLRE